MIVDNVTDQSGSLHCGEEYQHQKCLWEPERRRHSTLQISWGLVVTLFFNFHRLLCKIMIRVICLGSSLGWVVIDQHIFHRLYEGEKGVWEGGTPVLRADQWQHRTRTEAVHQACRACIWDRLWCICWGMSCSECSWMKGWKKWLR